MATLRRGGEQSLRGDALGAEEPADGLRKAGNGERLRVMLIDDEPLMLTTLTRLFRRDFAVTALGSAAQALERLQSGEHFDVILCDLMMPEISGMDLHAALERIDPDMAARMVFVTGGAFGPASLEFLGRVPNERVDKPFNAESLRAVVRRVAGRRVASRER